MSEVLLMTNEVELPPLRTEAVARWIDSVAAAMGKVAGKLTYMFCDDEYILAANRQFLGHDYYTDIITFDYSTRKRISGDMLISLDTVRSNAALVGTDYRQELLRVVIHGVLHLCGINDKGEGEREIMEQFENKALAMVPDDIWEK